MLRPLVAADIGPLLELWKRSLPFDGCDAALVQEKVWQDPDFDPQMAWVSGEGQRLDGFALGVERNGKSYVKLLCVDPDRRNRGLGSRLLQTLEERFTQPEIRVGESNPNYLVPGVDVRHTIGSLFLEKHGYSRFAETYNLQCELQDDSFEDRLPLGPPSFEPESIPVIHIERARPEHWSKLQQFLSQHFPGWLYEVGRMLQNEPVSLHLAWKDQQLLGFSGYDGNNVGHGWFGPMGTDPNQRGLGVGRILLRRCLADLKAQGRCHCIIPWVGPYGFYARHSHSRIDRVFWRYRKERITKT